MSGIDLSEFSKYAPNVLIKNTGEGYTIRISRSNYWVLGFSIAISFFGFLPLYYAFASENSFLFLPAALFLYFAVYTYRLTLGYLEVRFAGNLIEFIWEEEIKQGERGEMVDIRDIESVGLGRVKRAFYSRSEYASESQGYIIYLEITLKDNSKKLFSCVHPAYCPCVSIFIKKYLRELRD